MQSPKEEEPGLSGRKKGTEEASGVPDKGGARWGYDPIWEKKKPKPRVSSQQKKIRTMQFTNCTALSDATPRQSHLAKIKKITNNNVLRLYDSLRK